MVNRIAGYDHIKRDIGRKRFDPLWRADTLLASQVQLAAQERGLLKKVPLFSGLSPQQLATVDVALVRQSFVAGETLAAQGSPRTHLFIVAEGQVDVWLEDARLGRERWVGSLGQGEHFGEYALFADTPYSATYRASTDVELLLLDEPTFDKLAESCEVMSHYIEQIGTGRQLAVSRRAGLGGILA